MVQTVSKPVRQAEDKSQQARPWHCYRKEKQWKLLQPGWAGTLDDDELQFILSKLQVASVLSYWWGFRPQTKRRPLEAIKAVAMWGSPDVRSENVKLVRPHQHPVATQIALPWG
jgi:hypothetical protein